MIQRLQTIYLLAIVAICGILCVGSVLNVQAINDGIATDYVLSLIYFKVYENKVLLSSEIQYVLIALTSFLVVWTFRVIFSFKDRKQQIKLARFNFILMLLLVGGIFSKAAMAIPGFNLSSLSLSSIFGQALLIFIFYLNFRAIRLIKKDEELVKSADRLR